MTDLAIFLDFETTGLPDFSAPSEAEHQPHIVQLAAVLYDSEADKPLNRFCLTVAPDGWESGEQALAVHGITTEHAKATGMDEETVLRMFFAMSRPEVPIVGYNVSFDMRILRIAMCRFLGKPVADRFKAERTTEDAMKMAKDHLEMDRNPKLVDAYESIMGKPYKGAHDAMADVVATIQIYQAVRSK